MIVISFGIKEGTCTPSWIFWGLVSPPSFWVLPRSWSWCQLTICSGPLPLTGLMHYTVGSGGLPTTTNFSLYIYLGFNCNSPGDHLIKPSFPLEFPVTWFNLAALFCILCQMLLNAHLFMALTNLCCCWMHQSFQMDLLQLYWDNPNQLLQGVWALWPNINWYIWYPVVKWGMALYANTKAPRSAGQLGFWSLGVSVISFATCSVISCMVNFCEDYIQWWWIVLHHKSCTIAQWFYCQNFWDSIIVKPFIHQGFGYSFCLLVWHYYCHTKFRECISHY